MNVGPIGNLLCIPIVLALALGSCRNRTPDTMPPTPHDTVRSAPGTDTASHRPGL